MMTNEIFFDSQFNDISQDCAEAITGSTGCDVIIMNSVLAVLGGTGRYRAVVGKKILNNSAFEKVLSFGKRVEIQQRDNFTWQTMEKKIYEDEENFTFLCYPIKKDEIVLGAIAVTIKEDKGSQRYILTKSKVINSINTTIELIVSKIQVRGFIKRIELIEQQFEVMYSNTQDGIIIIDSDNRIIRYNYKVKEFLKVKNTTLIGRLIGDLFSNIETSLISNIKGVSNIIELENKDSGFIGTGLIIPIMVDESYSGAIVILLTNFRIDTSIYRNTNGNEKITFNDIIGQSKAIKETIKIAKKISPHRSNIILMGESGTGKELFARSIHNYSHFRGEPFVAINCAAIPESLIESELWGYEKGAFTGANSSGKPGKFEIAKGGTIFLDEISEMPLFLQAKLLRIIQERKVVRLGGVKDVNLDVRIISATNKNLEELVHNGSIRRDLYYRINVIELTLPPLRERFGDIPILVNHLSDYYSRILNMPKLLFEPEALNTLEEFRWEGNVRELQNLIESLYCTSERKIILSTDIADKLKGNFEKNQTFLSKKELTSYNTEITPITNLVKQEIIRALNRFGNTARGKAETARALGISPATLYRKIKKLKISHTENNFS